MIETVIEFLKKLPYDKTEYVYWIEDTAYYRSLHLHELQSRGVTEEAIMELQTAWKQNLPHLIKDTYPKLTAMQVEGTIQLIFDVAHSEFYLDSLFNCLNAVLLEESGHELLTIKFNLQPTAVQLN